MAYSAIEVSLYKDLLLVWLLSLYPSSIMMLDVLSLAGMTII